MKPSELGSEGFFYLKKAVGGCEVVVLRQGAAGRLAAF